MKSIDMKDSVGKWYKDKAKELNVIPPHEAWENIEKSMEDWPKHWYQSNFDGMQSENGNRGWEAIEEKLEIQRNVKKYQRNFYLRTASLIAGLALIPMWISNVSNNTTFISEPVTPNLAVASNTQVSNVENLINEAASIPAIQEIQNLTSNPLRTNNSTIIVTPAVSINSTQNNAVATKPIQTEFDLTFLASLPTGEIAVELPYENDLVQRTTESIRYAEPSENKQETQKNWFVGPTFIVGSSELLNPLSFREDAVTSNNLDVAWGISGSRRFNKNVLTTDLLFSDTKSQMASLNSEEVTTSLNYVTAALQYERVAPIFKSAKKLRPELNLGGGVFGSILTNSTISSNQSNSYYSEFSYRNFDVGGVLTAGASVQIGESFRVGVNARVQSGVVNLFEGREKVPSNLFRTQSMATGIQAKLNYRF